jgi:hypothetical protein
MATTKETVLARISIDDNTKVGFQSYARNAERAKKTTEAFRAHAVDKLVESLDKQVLALGKNARELDLLKAATLNAADGELALINKLHDDIDAHNQATEAAIRLSKERDQEAAAAQKIADAVNRTNNAYRDEAATVDMTSDELEIYRLKMMGATKEQLDSVMATQRATKEFRKQGSAAKGAHGQLRLMRGGLGQVGHQVQDIAVQLQMGQNALLIFGQQGSQIASLFGQNGALIGALLAVGAALGTSLAPALFSSKSAMEELEKATEDLSKFMKMDGANGIAEMSDELLTLARISKDLARNKLEASLALAMLKVVETTQSATKAMAEFSANPYDSTPTVGEIGALANEFNIAFEDAEALSEAFQDIKNGSDSSGDSFRDLLLNVNQLTGATDKQKKAFLEQKNVILDDLVAREMANEKIKEAERILGDFDGELLRNNRTYKDANEEKKDFIDQLVKQGLELGKGESSLIRQQAEALKLSDAEMQIVEALILHKEGITELDDARKEASKTAAKLLAKQEQLKESTINFVSGVVAQADALGKSNIELLLANDLVKGLDTEQKKAFDNAIQRLKDFQAAQEEAQKVESSKGNLESLRQSLMTEEQALLESFAEQNRVIAEGLALGNETEQSARDLQLQILAKYLEDKKALLDQGVTDELEGMSFLQRASIEGAKRLESFNKLSATEQTEHVLGELGNQFNGIAKNNKRLFAISKAFNIANAIMNTSTAATVAYKSYPPPLNYVMAGGVIAAGMGQVAQIKAQSFDGGGFTGTGGRSGGMDGKGGFPAILHPNETVVDHTKGQGGGITVVNNIDATGADANVDMKIRAAVQQSSQQTIMSIQDLMRRRRFG